MRILTSLLVAMVGLGCGRGGLEGTPDVAQPLTTTTSSSTALTGTWALGANTIKGLPGPNDTLENAGSPYAMLTVRADGTFDLWFGAGCIVEGLSGTWLTTPSGGLLVMQPDQWQSWTDGAGEHPRPTSLSAVRDADKLHVTGVDEKGHSIDQRWRPYGP